MKKVFAYIGILVILLGVFAPMHTTSAQVSSPTNIGGADSARAMQAKAAQAAAAASAAAAAKDPSNAQLQAKAAADAKAATQTVASCNQGNSSALGMIGGWVMTALARIGYMALQISAELLGLSGLLLNKVISITILNMSDNLKGMVGIGIVSKVIRDLMNIMFIFILVYQGIKMIIGRASSATIRSIIGGIIAASLIINFASFYTKVIFDASNIATVGFYNSIMGEDATSRDANTGISNAFMSALNLTSFFDSKVSTSFSDVSTMAGGDSTKIFIITMGGSILFIITTFIFVAMSAMYAMRYLVCIALLMTAAISVVGLAFPGMKSLGSLSDKWWSTLTGQALFPPINMIMVWIVITLMTNKGFLNEVTASGNLATVMTKPDQSSILLLLNFFLIIGLMVYSLILSKNFATQGVKQIGDWTGKATAFAGGAVFGGAGALGRNTIGRIAANKANDKGLQERADMGSRSAKMQLAASKYVAGGSFDVRRSAVAEKAQDLSGVDLGKGIPFNPKAGEGGFAGTKTQKQDKDRKEIDAIIRKYRAEPAKLAQYLMNQKDGDQKYIYDKLSARDRAAVDSELLRLSGSDALTKKLRGDLSIEEQEKTEKADKEASKAAKEKEKNALIKELVTTGTTTSVNPATSHPYTFDDLLGPIGGPSRLSPKSAKSLGTDARKNNEVIMRLTPQHLKNLMDDGLEDDEIIAITTKIGTPPPVAYPGNDKQYAYISGANVRHMWGV